MVHYQYVSHTVDRGLAHLIEELGEATSAAGKSLRFGLGSTNPVTGDPETNAQWLVREMEDVQLAYDKLLSLITKSRYNCL